jgi:hypothetical protein
MKPSFFLSRTVARHIWDFTVPSDTPARAAIFS